MPILTDEERIGTTLAGRYRLERILGRGGMGIVYAAEHTWSKRKVAVKLLLGDLARDQSAVQRFLQEARTAAALEHPNVVQVLDVGQAEDGSVFMAQELLRGRTLANVLDARGRLSVAETLELLLPVIDALAVAHESGIVHRDLKPDNVFLAEDATGRVVPKLLDFGIAKVLRGGLATMTGTMVGSPAFMSPEQAECRKDVGPATDIWSIGVVLHRCVAGAYPFDYPEDASPASVLAAILTRTPRSLVGRAPDVAAHVAAAVDRALAKEPANRHPSMRALHKALRAEASGVSATIVATPPPSSASTAAGVVTMAAGTGTQMWTPAPAKGPTPFGWQGTAQSTDSRPAKKAFPTFAAAAALGAVLLVAGAGAVLLSRDAPTDSPPSGGRGGVNSQRSTASSVARAALASPTIPAVVALDAGADVPALTAPLAHPVDVEPLLPPVEPLTTAPPEQPTTRRSREPARARPGASRSSPTIPTVFVPPRPTPAAPRVIDNGIRVPD